MTFDEFPPEHRSAGSIADRVDVDVDQSLSAWPCLEDPSEHFPGTAVHLGVCPGCRADLDGVIEAARHFPGTAVHLGVCPGCRADLDGVIEAARLFGELEPD